MEHHDFYPFLGWFYLLSAWYSLPPTIFFGFFCLLAYYPQDHLVLSLSNLRSYAGHLDLAYLGFFSLLAYYPQDYLVLSHSSTSREHDLVDLELHWVLNSLQTIIQRTLKRRIRKPFFWVSLDTFSLEGFL